MEKTLIWHNKSLQMALIGGLAAATAAFLILQAGGSQKTVVLAARDIEKGTMLTENMVRSEKIPQNLVLKGALVSKKDALGKRVGASRKANEQITKTNVDENVSSGMREMQKRDDYVIAGLKVDDLDILEDRLRYGTRINVMAITSAANGQGPQAMTVLRNVRVMDIHGSAGSKLGQQSKGIQIALTIEESERLAAYESQGALRIVIVGVQE